MVERQVATAIKGDAVAEHELVIRGGSVVDGTGAPVRTADVAVDEGPTPDHEVVVGHGPTVPRR